MNINTASALTQTPNKDLIKDWFFYLRDQLCEAFERIEQECENPQTNKPAGKFERKKWDRVDGGGGEMSVMRGRIFEKVGVNISVVYGNFSPEFRKQIPGAESTGEFWAVGVSVVSHMWSPHVPAMHFNTRFIETTRHWFGGGMDVTPTFPDEQETLDYHQQLESMCNKFDPKYYPQFKKWCDEYFFLKHRDEARGVGGIFFDYHNSGNWEADLEFIKANGLLFRDYYSRLIRRTFEKPWTPQEREGLLIKRGRYVEFNLLYDRGTQFGLQTNGSTEAILMSMPPEVKWP